MSSFSTRWRNGSELGSNNIVGIKVYPKHYDLIQEWDLEFRCLLACLSKSDVDD